MDFDGRVQVIVETGEDCVRITTMVAEDGQLIFSWGMGKEEALELSELLSEQAGSLP